jgi:hypothetical protein
MTMDVRVLKLRRDPNCVVCGEHPTVTDLIDYEGFCSGVSAVNGNGNGVGHPAEPESAHPHA